MHLYLSFVLLLLLSLCNAAQWESSLTFEDPEDESLKRGVFKNLILTLKSDTLHRAKALLRVKDGEYPFPISMAYPVKIDTHKELIYSFYVGISAESEFNDDEQLKIQFEIVNGEGDMNEDFNDADQFTQPNEITVTLSTEREPLFITTTYQYLPAGSWVLYNLMNNILNVDEITVDFNLYIADGIEIEAKTFPPFKGIVLSDDERMSGMIIANDNAKPGPRVFDVDLGKNSPFYVMNKELTVYVTNGGIAEMSELERVEMMKTLEYIDIGDINRISLQVKVIPYPSMLTCICQQSRDPFPDDDEIREFFSYHEDDDEEDEDGESQHKKIFQRFVANQQYQTIFFDEMSRLGRFKIKCLLDNTSIMNRKTFTFTVGNYDGADLKVQLMDESNAPIFPNCLTFNFKQDLNDEEREKLTKQIDYYSNDYISTFVKNQIQIEEPNKTYNWSDNGCFIWNERDLVELPNSAIGFCLEAVENCNTKFNYNSTEFAVNFTSTIDDENKFRNAIETNIRLENITIESDNSAPNITLINGRYIFSDEKRVYIQVINHIDQRIICHYKKASRVTLYVSTVEDILGYNTIYLEPNETRSDVVIELEKEGFTEQMYSVMVVCMNNPGASYSSHYTIPFPLVVYYNRRGFTAKEYDKVPRLDCSAVKDRYMEPECLTEIQARRIPDYIGDFKKENNTDDEELFYLMPNAHQIQLLEDELDFMLDAPDMVAYFDDLSYVGEMLGRRTCQHTYNYNKCREQKKEVFSEMLNHFQQTFTIDNYDKILNLTTANKVKTVKAFLETVFYLTNNPDSISSIFQIEFLFSFIDSIDVKDLFDFCKASIPDRIDIVKVLAASTVNLLDILIFARADKIIEDDIDVNTGIIKNSEYVIRQQFLMVYVLKQFWDLGETHFDYDTFGFYLYGHMKDPQTRDSGYVDDWQVQTYFENLDIEIAFRHQLLEKYGGDFVHVYSYKRYPFIKMGTTSVYENFVGLSMYDKDFVAKDVENIEEDLMVNVTYHNSKHISNEFQKCLVFDELKDEFRDDGTHFQRYREKNVEYEYVLCRLPMFGVFTLGKQATPNEESKEQAVLVVILSILALALLIVVGYGVVLFIKRKSQKIIPEPIAEAIVDGGRFSDQI